MLDIIHIVRKWSRSREFIAKNILSYDERFQGQTFVVFTLGPPQPKNWIAEFGTFPNYNDTLGVRVYYDKFYKLNPGDPQFFGDLFRLIKYGAKLRKIDTSLSRLESINITSSMML
jgi:hypothetical protein